MAKYEVNKRALGIWVAILVVIGGSAVSSSAGSDESSPESVCDKAQAAQNKAVAQARSAYADGDSSTVTAKAVLSSLIVVREPQCFTTDEAMIANDVLDEERRYKR